MALKVWQDVDGGGKSTTFSGDDKNLKNKKMRGWGDNWNDEISSLMVTDPNEKWMVFTDTDFKGQAYGPFTYDPGGSHYNAFDWFPNDSISSVKKYPASMTTSEIEAELDISLGGANVRTVSEISNREAVVDDSQGDQGLPGQWDDRLFEDALIPLAEDTKKALTDLADVVKNALEDIRKEFRDFVWDRVKWPLIIFGILALLLLVGSIVAVVLVWKNREKIRDEQTRHMEHQLRMSEMQSMFALSTANRAGQVIENNPTATRMVAAGATGGTSEAALAASQAASAAPPPPAPPPGGTSQTTTVTAPPAAPVKGGRPAGYKPPSGGPDV